MSEPVELRCPRCEERVEPGQEYCLECGGRLARIVPRQVDGASAARPGSARTWLLPSLLGLVVAAVGTGGALAISGANGERTAIATAIGGAPTVTEERETLTAPEPASGAKPAVTNAPPAAAKPAPSNPAVATWPRGRRGWTIVLLSLPQAKGRREAAAKAQEARKAGLRRVGILDSSRYASLHPGYYVVFTGIFESQPEAIGSLQRARAVFPAAYQREIVP